MSGKKTTAETPNPFAVAVTVLDASAPQSIELQSAPEPAITTEEETTP
jgi:hypothetical protein